VRRLSAPALLLLLFGCSFEDNAIRFDSMATMLNTGDPRANKQLISGFWGYEGLGRWTGRTFRAVLRPPAAAARKGAILVLRAGVPASSIERLRTIQIGASVNGVAVPPQEYSQAGEFLYIRDVPARAFANGNATVDFTLDKALPPSGSEHRELGVVVNTVGFEAK